MPTPMRLMTALLVAAVLSSGGNSVRAAPTKQQVEATIAHGDMARAERMLREVLSEHPDNALAHYLLGQVLSKLHQPSEGLAELDRAQTLDPSIHFTNPQKFEAVRQRIAAEAGGPQVTGASATTSANSGTQGSSTNLPVSPAQTAGTKSSSGGKCMPVDDNSRPCVSLVGSRKDGQPGEQINYVLTFRNSCNTQMIVRAVRRQVYNPGDNGVSETGISPGGTSELNCVDYKDGHAGCGGFTEWSVPCNR